MKSDNDIAFLQWALPQMGYRWEGFRKPRNQVLKRIRGRLQQLGLSGGYSEYKQFLQEHPGEWEHLDRLCDVTISKFFRDRKVWEFLRDHVLLELLKNKNRETVNIWSAGCCNGEEPYSLAVISEQLAENHDGLREGNAISILASDRNAEVLDRAILGRYPAGSLKELTQNEIKTFFHHVNNIDDVDYEVNNRLKQYVTFEQRDIQQSLHDQVFDLILCRNLVFTYFSKERQVKFLEQLKSHLAEHGFLVIGSNEKLPEHKGFEVISNTHRVFRMK